MYTYRDVEIDEDANIDDIDTGVDRFVVFV